MAGKNCVVCVDILQCFHIQSKRFGKIHSCNINHLANVRLRPWKICITYIVADLKIENFGLNLRGVADIWLGALPLTVCCAKSKITLGQKFLEVRV